MSRWPIAGHIKSVNPQSTSWHLLERRAREEKILNGIQMVKGNEQRLGLRSCQLELQSLTASCRLGLQAATGFSKYILFFFF